MSNEELELRKKEIALQEEQKKAEKRQQNMQLLHMAQAGGAQGKDLVKVAAELKTFLES